MKALHVRWCVFLFPQCTKTFTLHTPPNSTQILRIFRSVLRGDSETAVTYLLPGLDCSADCLTALQLQQKYSFCHQSWSPPQSSEARGVSDEYVPWMLFILINSFFLAFFHFSQKCEKGKKNLLCSDIYVTLLKKTESPLLLPTVGSLVCI